MKLLANENFPLKSAQILPAQGFDVKVVGLEFVFAQSKGCQEVFKEST